MSDADKLRTLAYGGADFISIIAHLTERISGELTPLKFLMVFQEELGIPFVEARIMLEYFDPQMKPIAEAEIINERWRSLLSRYRPLDS